MISSYDRQPRHRKWIRALRALCSRGGLEAEAISPESTGRFSPSQPVALYGEPKAGGQSDRVLEFQH
jgi:hypothetical protein